MSVDYDNDSITAIFARIHNDDRAPTGGLLEIGEEWEEKETREIRQLADSGHNFVQLNIEIAHPTMLICTR